MKKDAQHSNAQKNIVQLRIINNPKYGVAERTEKASAAVGLKPADSSRHQDNRQLTSDAFIIMRLNELDVMEETFGHLVATELASLVSDRLQGCLRPMDILERINSNEFAIMVADVDSKNYIEQLVQRIEVHCNGEYVCSNLKLISV